MFIYATVTQEATKQVLFKTCQNHALANEPFRPRLPTDLKQYMPPDHPTVTPAQRAETIRARLSGLNRKKNPVYNRDIK